MLLWVLGPPNLCPEMGVQRETRSWHKEPATGGGKLLPPPPAAAAAAAGRQGLGEGSRRSWQCPQPLHKLTT